MRGRKTVWKTCRGMFSQGEVSFQRKYALYQLDLPIWQKSGLSQHVSPQYYSKKWVQRQMHTCLEQVFTNGYVSQPRITGRSWASGVRSSMESGILYFSLLWANFSGGHSKWDFCSPHLPQNQLTIHSCHIPCNICFPTCARVTMLLPALEPKTIEMKHFKRKWIESYQGKKRESSKNVLLAENENGRRILECIKDSRISQR